MDAISLGNENIAAAEIDARRERCLTDAVLRVPLRKVEMFERVVVPPQATLQEVIEKMRERRTGAVLVDDPATGALEGIFTERDLMLRVAGQGWNYHEHTIQEVMTPDPDCLTLSDTVGFALNLMMTRGYRHVPIVQKGRVPYGIVSVRNLLHYMWDFFPDDMRDDAT